MGYLDEKWNSSRPLYVVCDDYAWESNSLDDSVWTVSPAPDEEGWRTDTANSSYGLPKWVAERIAALWNANLKPINGEVEGDD